MTITHSTCSIESRHFCEDLLKSLQYFEPTTTRHEKTTCGFLAEDTNRFAFLYHKKKSLLAQIYLRGSTPDIIPSLSNGVKVVLRKKMTGQWPKEFPMYLDLTHDSLPDEVAELLVKYSLPLAVKKRKSKRVRLNDIEYSEGEPQTVLLTQYERNQTLRAICLKHFGYRCAGCGLLLAERYGKIAETLIHVHHLERLADTGKHQVDPKKDLIPLCPNCHAVVHLKNPPIPIEKLRQLIIQ